MSGPSLSLVMPFYRNPGMLSLHYETWSKFRFQAWSPIEVVLVDDGSPDAEAATTVPVPDELSEKLAIRIFRCREDRPWFQHGARNIGAHEARGTMLLLTDMDHLATQGLLLAALNVKERHRAYFVRRLEAIDGRPMLDKYGREKAHPNTFVVSKQRFWRSGGYDEDYCGVYGTDGLFRRRLEAITGKLRQLPGDGVVIIRYHRGIVDDASTRDVVRKEGREPGFREKIAERKKREGRDGKIVTLSMPYDLVWQSRAAQRAS